ncbi:BON domain-containing protein [Legionella sp. W05-934-2]|uniref:BON domain-containing protein n=1 Tax=Legionella sp. W05-934-2 TaxID=1198649 RepID=UPI003463123B
MKKLLVSILILMSLTRCAGFVVAGAAAGAVVYDSRNLIEIEKDARIFHLVHKRIVRDPKFAFSSVQVNVFNQVVLLTGQVSSAAVKIEAEKIARMTPQVERVYDQLELEEPLALSQQSIDSWITSEISAKMLATKNLRSGAIKVVTNNNVVYLMGIVKKSQAAIAVDIARRTDRVKKVVKVFQYIV